MKKRKLRVASKSHQKDAGDRQPSLSRDGSYSIEPLSLAGLHTYPLATRPAKVHVGDFAKPLDPGMTFSQFLGSLPSILAAQDLRNVRDSLIRAKREQRVILWGIGGHVIKVGLGPILIDLMKRGFITAIAMNGAALVHDFEIALSGGTSEDVDQVLGNGQFGMAEETGRYVNEAAVHAHQQGMGLGQAMGQLLSEPAMKANYPESSVLIQAYRAGMPVTVHLAIGTDIPHMHQTASGEALGAATHHDFRLFCALVKNMQPGGVYLNWGSAVMLPEVFLKAVTVARNLGSRLEPITTANFDFIQHYRPSQNVVKRPTASTKPKTKSGSRGFSITGHHEIMMPLLAATLVDSDRQRASK
jgi:hypothetical protein